MIRDTSTLRIAGVVRESIVDGPGIRFVVFCQGCSHNCKGCHNPDTHDFSGGYDCPIGKIIEAIDQNQLISGVTFSGGEPACQPEGFLALAKKIKERNLDIVMFSGYTYEQLLEMGEKNPALIELLQYVDLLIDGKYIQEQRDLTLQFRGSKNQRIIDMNETRKKGYLTLAEKYI
ncbi:MAG: anaerobic ribonucleoside-triphosphate reductase activating protein [Eubacteriales bacterium]|nr:anaerobic ribonucleoside-triphosphate reductase activating protein [Eubacteriales bacterium]